MSAAESAATGDKAEPDQIQVTVSAPAQPETVSLTAKSDDATSAAATSAVMAAPSVTTVEPEDIKLSPVAVTNTPTVTNQPTAAAQSSVKSQPADDFYRTIFYFSGMGRVIGSALAEGVYVDEKNRRNAIDPEDVEKFKRGGGEEKGGDRKKMAAGSELLTTARSQATNLSTDFRQLQSLLQSLPTFTDAGSTSGGSGAGGIRLDEPIHGEIYFRSERPELYQQQQRQQQQQRMRQAQTFDHGGLISTYGQQNGHLISVPWSYHNSY